MRYYFAGAYARREELFKYGIDLIREVRTARVVSRWLTDPQEGLDAGFSAGGLESPEAIAKAWTYGRRDMDDVRSAQAIVSFTGEGTRGGRHVEHGMGLLLNDLRRITGYRLIVIGPREHVFHCHPATEHFADWAAFLKYETERETK